MAVGRMARRRLNSGSDKGSLPTKYLVRAEAGSESGLQPLHGVTINVLDGPEGSTVASARVSTASSIALSCATAW